MKQNGNRTNQTIGVIGDFSDGEFALAGSVTKARNIRALLADRYGKSNIFSLDTHDWKKHIFTKLHAAFFLKRKCKIIVLVVCQNGLNFFLNFFFRFGSRNRLAIFYQVVGGWLAEYLNAHNTLLSYVKKIDGIFVETKGLKVKLENLGLTNIFYEPVFSCRARISETNLDATLNSISRKPLPFCTFSRVTKDKGIFLAIDAIEKNNQENPECCSLDIYGYLDSQFKEEFFQKLSCSPHVFYHGVIKDEEVEQLLSRHFVMLFPTFYPGEGFPATILEAYMAGVPVIASDWKYNSELITKRTGFLVDAFSTQALYSAIKYCIVNSGQIFLMHKECLSYSESFLPEKILQPFFQMIDSKIRI